ncbi:MAG: hypothetical protein ACI83O_000239, partial [Patescibacteria group bacterium]
MERQRLVSLESAVDGHLFKEVVLGGEFESEYASMTSENYGLSDLMAYSYLQSHVSRAKSLRDESESGPYKVDFSDPYGTAKEVLSL